MVLTIILWWRLHILWLWRVTLWGELGRDTAVAIVAAVVGRLAAVEVVDIAAASAFGRDDVDAVGVEPGIGVAVVAADTLGIAAVGGASAVVGTVRRRVEEPTR
jgi:hypothetical protein